ncbi:MAG TPA: helix-turn-helix transcriptional regulator [Pseudonocardiaceae bacterium]|nr:helix-turn-helix transcriptional regulator [Pseudonocardiaceae bacterium]
MAVVAGNPRARALAAGLRKAREATGMSGRELARRVKVSQGLVTHWECCRRIPRVEHVVMVLMTCDTAAPERDRLLDIAHHVNDPNWLTVGVPGISQQLAGVVESEEAASKIIQWSPVLIPGLLQTPDYARVIVSQNGREQKDVQARVMIRMGRREIITRRDAVEFTAIIGETALRDPVVEPDLMAEQLHYLIELGVRPNIDLRVISSNIGWHPGSTGPFVLYEFPDSGSVVHFEHHSSGAFVPDEHDIKQYESAIEVLKEIAKSPEVSREFITDIAKGWANHRE